MLASELGIENDTSKITELKKLITEIPSYDENIVKELLNAIIDELKNKEMTRKGNALMNSRKGNVKTNLRKGRNLM
ncbi:hypothetical protein CEXT_197731 [Caerostris extrusa]|uniref:Uncharacterized protein n=1 Tax=Caerostris extrusa TaxID=172846 RepID=A0AAV4URW1_CAEEX|nr:hypothetical protein CEXT_197731 [Caerostris extrusa]